MKLYLKLYTGEEHQFQTDEDCITIGRSRQCDVVTPFIGVSRKHLQVEVVEGEVYVTDLGSTNGVFIDGEKITPHERTHYKTFLPLSFGSVQNMSIDVVSTEKIPEKIDLVTKSFTQTETVRMKVPLAPKKTVNTKKQNKLKHMIIPNIIALIILGLIFYYFI